MRFSVEAWAPEYGAAADGDVLAAGDAVVDVTVERPVAAWAPVSPPQGVRPPSRVLFTDGVRRVDATVWIEGPDGTRPGICASYAAGVVACDARARVVAAAVERGLFTACPGAEAVGARHAAYPVRAAPGDSPEQLSLGLQQRMGELEVALASTCEGGDLVVVDGPLSGRQNVPGAVGLVKTHRVRYLPPSVEGIVPALGPGERTPFFLTMTSWSRYSWYLRLPCPVEHAWSGVVRCEASADAEADDVARLADLVAATLPRFASQGHKDPRAPQNLYPIAGLERELRRRLGDGLLLYRSLREAAHAGQMRGG